MPQARCTPNVSTAYPTKLLFIDQPFESSTAPSDLKPPPLNTEEDEAIKYSICTLRWCCAFDSLCFVYQLT